MITELIDRLALWWLDRRPAPLDDEPTIVRFIGGPLDGTTADRGPRSEMRAAYWAADDWHTYRPDGTSDPDGAMRLCYDPQEGQ